MCNYICNKWSVHANICGTLKSLITDKFVHLTLSPSSGFNLQIVLCVMIELATVIDRVSKDIVPSLEGRTSSLMGRHCHQEESICRNTVGYLDWCKYLGNCVAHNFYTFYSVARPLRLTTQSSHRVHCCGIIYPQYWILLLWCNHFVGTCQTFQFISNLYFFFAQFNFSVCDLNGN